MKTLLSILFSLALALRPEAQAVRVSSSNGEGRSPAVAQTPVFIYKLHASKQAHATSYLARTPDNAILVFAAQGDNRWSLIRVRGLESSSPREEQLTIMGLPPVTPFERGFKGDADIHVRPDGQYVVARTQRFEPLRDGRRDARAMIAVIDLRSWKIISARSTTDPLEAGSSWTFNKEGELITEAFPESTGRPGHFDQAHSDTHKAGSLLLPDLRPSVTCEYTEVFGPALRSRGSSHREKSISDLSDGCRELIKRAGASSVKDIYRPTRNLDRIAQEIHFAPEDFASPPHTNSFNGCGIIDVGHGERFALYTCTRAHLAWYDAMKTTALSLSVVFVPERKEVLRVPRPVKRIQAAILATLSGQDNLVILEEGVNLIVYRL